MHTRPSHRAVIRQRCSLPARGGGSRARSPARGLAALVAILALAAFRPHPAHATSALAMLSIEQLTERSDLVVEGRVGAIRPALEGQRIFTYVDLHPVDVLKGEQPGAPIVVKLYGGAYGEYRTAIDGAPCFDRGEHVVVFLKARRTGTYGVVNLAEGKFRLASPAAATARVTRDLRGIAYLDAGVKPVIPETLAGLKTAIRAAARTQRREP